MTYCKHCRSLCGPGCTAFRCCSSCQHVGQARGSVTVTPEPRASMEIVAVSQADARQQRAVHDIRRARYDGSLTPPADADYSNDLDLQWENELMKQRANEITKLLGPPNALDTRIGGIAVWLEVKRRPDTQAAYTRLMIQDRSYFHEDRPADHEDGFFGYARIVCPREIQLLLPQVSSSFTYYSAGQEAGAGCHFFGAIIASLSIMWQLANESINLGDAMPEYGARIKKLLAEEMRDKQENEGTPLADAYEKLYLGWADRSEVVRVGASLPRGSPLSLQLSFSTWNMNGFVRSQRQWESILEGNPAWRQELLGGGRSAIIALALQEVNSSDKLEGALESRLQAWFPQAGYRRAQQKLRSVASRDFGQRLLVWMKRGLPLRGSPSKKSVCFGAAGTCVKGSLITQLPLPGGRSLLLVGSHLPFDPKAEDLGMKQRSAAFRRTRSELEKLRAGGEALVVWGGDLNYRKLPNGRDQLSQALKEGRPPYQGFQEADIYFDPTCKMAQCRRGAACPVCRTKSVSTKGEACYVATRAPSHCDRVLYAVLGATAAQQAPSVSVTLYNTFFDQKSAITSHSDHDMVRAELQLSL